MGIKVDDISFLYERGTAMQVTALDHVTVFSSPLQGTFITTERTLTARNSTRKSSARM